jgi:hypothetical protein
VLSEHAHHSFLAGSLPMTSAWPVWPWLWGFLVNFSCTEFSEVAPPLVPHHTMPVGQRGGADEPRPPGEEAPTMAGEEHHLDALAKGMAEETIPRGRAIKLAGAALVGSALSLFVADDAAEARNRRRDRRDRRGGDESRRRRCRRRGGRFCEDRRDGTNRARCCRQPTSSSRCRRGRCGGGRKRDRDNEEVVNISGI